MIRSPLDLRLVFFLEPQEQKSPASVRASGLTFFPVQPKYYRQDLDGSAAAKNVCFVFFLFISFLVCFAAFDPCRHFQLFRLLRPAVGLFLVTGSLRVMNVGC